MRYQQDTFIKRRPVKYLLCDLLNPAVESRGGLEARLKPPSSVGDTCRQMVAREPGSDLLACPARVADQTIRSVIKVNSSLLVKLNPYFWSQPQCFSQRTGGLQGAPHRATVKARDTEAAFLESVCLPGVRGRTHGQIAGQSLSLLMPQPGQRRITFPLLWVIKRVVCRLGMPDDEEFHCTPTVEPVRNTVRGHPCAAYADV